MFVDRVLAADRRYRFLPESLPWVRRLCVDLDGLPLALEMAAARVPLLGLQRVHDALAERFSMLRHGQRDAPGRHRTLLAALDWSHDLLAPEEQRMFRALGVFAGGFTLDLAVAVAGSDAADAWDTIDRIAVLVDRSLVVGDHEDPPRYGLLETMRSYALVRLAACADENAVRARHAKALCELIGRADEAPRDPSGNELRRLGLQEMHNVREALSWAMQHDRPTAVALAVCASGLATFTTWRREVSGWLAACEPLLDASIEPRLQALWWRNFARQMMFGGNPRAVEAAWKAVALSRAVGDDSNLFWSLVPLARAWPSPNAELDAITDEMSRVLERHPEWPANARLVAIGTLAHVCFARGDFEGALKHRLAELGHARRAGIANHIGSAENNVAHALIQLGRHAEALDRLQAYLQEVGDDTSVNVVYVRALAIRAQLEMGRIEEALADAAMVIPAGRRYGVPEVADLAALLAARAGRPRSAALLLGHARETYASRGMQEPTGDCDFSKAESLLRERLDGATFERLMEQGRRLDEPAADRLLFANDDAAFHKFS
jgi:tetratricopeptide (TPR) repeat protein